MVAPPRIAVFPGSKGVLHWFLDDPPRAQGTEEGTVAAPRAVRGEVSRRTPRRPALPPEERARRGTDSPSLWIDGIMAP